MVIKSNNNNGKNKGSYLLCAFCVSDTALSTIVCILSHFNPHSNPAKETFTYLTSIYLSNAFCVPQAVL